MRLKFSSWALATVLFGIISALIYVASLPAQYASGSIATGDQYQATSTAPSAVFGAQTNAIQLLKTGQGDFGSVVVLGTTNGALSFYDATTTNITKRAASMATSSILLVTLPKGIGAGTYVFDIQFTTGLIYTTHAAEALASTTITWR